jgi:hypothetical protein
VITRRSLLGWTGAAAVVAALPRIPLLAGCGDNLQLAHGRFFDEFQWLTVDALTDLVLPGARVTGAVGYIDKLLSAFDDSPPAIFAGGPASGREANPDGMGGSTGTYPPDNFSSFLQLTRVQELAWRIRLFGSAATPGGDFNDAALGATVGLRDLYTQGLLTLDAIAATHQKKARFLDLGDDDRQLSFASLADQAPAFLQALTENTIEGMFAAPEYGGNAARSGWQLARFDGDSVPLGHAQYVAAMAAYVDRADEPTSLPTPGDRTETFSADVIQTLQLAALGSGGKQFF